MQKNTLDESDLAALRANYPDTDHWHDATRIRSVVQLNIGQRLFTTVSGPIQPAPAPLETSLWSKCRIEHSDALELKGVRLHVPERLQPLLNFTTRITLDCLLYRNEAWLLTFERPGIQGLRHDLLAEWKELSAIPVERKANAAEEQILDPGRHGAGSTAQANWLLAAALIMPAGMLIMASLDASAWSLIPLLAGLAIALHNLRMILLPEGRDACLIRLDRPLERVAIKGEGLVYWHHCGELLLRQDIYLGQSGEPYDAATGHGTQVYVDKTPGQLQLRLARVQEHLHRWNSREQFERWLECRLEPDYLLLLLPGPALTALYQLISRSDLWLLAYSLSATACLLLCWRYWKQQARQSMLQSFDLLFE